MGNQNRLAHGWYSPVFSVDEIVDLVNLADDTTLDDEIAAVRVALRRVFKIIFDNELTSDQYAQLISLTFTGANTIARLLRAKKVISGEAADGISGSFATVLDELNDIFDVEL